MKRKIACFVLSILLLVLSTSAVDAIDVPDFPACSNPSGTLKADYPEGVHGVVGDTNRYEGSDKVYQVTDQTLIQCFCSHDGKGIQTNWWKIGSLNERQIETLKSQGWFFVPSGAAWGLSNDPYMAKNSEYACKDGGTSGAVLALASTGGSTNLYALATFGLMSLTGGILLRKRNERKAG